MVNIGQFPSKRHVSFLPTTSLIFVNLLVFQFVASNETVIILKFVLSIFFFFLYLTSRKYQIYLSEFSIQKINV